MPKTFLSLLAQCLLLTTALAQGTIRGTMTDAQTGETLIGANISRNNSRVLRTSDLAV